MLRGTVHYSEVHHARHVMTVYNYYMHAHKWHRHYFFINKADVVTLLSERGVSVVVVQLNFVSS